MAQEICAEKTKKKQMNFAIIMLGSTHNTNCQYELEDCGSSGHKAVRFVLVRVEVESRTAAVEESRGTKLLAQEHQGMNNVAGCG